MKMNDKMTILFEHVMLLKRTGVETEPVTIAIIHHPRHIYVVTVHLTNKKVTARRTPLIASGEFIHRIDRRIHPKVHLAADIVEIIVILLRHFDVIIAEVEVEVEAEKCMKGIQAIEDDTMIGVV